MKNLECQKLTVHHPYLIKGKSIIWERHFSCLFFDDKIRIGAGKLELENKFDVDKNLPSFS